MSTATTFTEVLPATKSCPHAAISWEPAGVLGRGVLTVESKRDGTTYEVTELPTDWAGWAFRLEKAAGETGTDAESEAYDVFVSRAGRGHSCHCRGFLRWDHCKHVALIENRWL